LANKNPDNWYGLDYVHDRIIAQLQEQSRLWEEADGRLRLILGVIGVVFAWILGLGILLLAAAAVVARRKPRPPDPLKANQGILSKMVADPAPLSATISGHPVKSYDATAAATLAEDQGSSSR